MHMKRKLGIVHYLKIINTFKGVLHPWPLLWLFMHFSQK